MPTAPKTHRPSHYTAPGERRKQHDQKRDSAKDRGYGHEWRKYAKALRNERAICELCMEANNTATPAADKHAGMVDHTVPVNGADDPLFWEPANHRVLCIECDRWKSNVFDGGFRGRGKAVPAVRTAAGIATRWSEVVQARRQGGGG